MTNAKKILFALIISICAVSIGYYKYYVPMRIEKRCVAAVEDLGVTCKNYNFSDKFAEKILYHYTVECISTNRTFWIDSRSYSIVEATEARQREQAAVSEEERIRRLKEKDADFDKQAGINKSKTEIAKTHLQTIKNILSSSELQNKFSITYTTDDYGNININISNKTEKIDANSFTSRERKAFISTHVCSQLIGIDFPKDKIIVNANGLFLGSCE